jgi:hypothetical protein
MNTIPHKKAIIPNETKSQNGIQLTCEMTKLESQASDGRSLITMLVATNNHKRKLKSQSIKNNAFFRLIF